MSILSKQNKITAKLKAKNNTMINRKGTWMFFAYSFGSPHVFYSGLVKTPFKLRPDHVKNFLCVFLGARCLNLYIKIILIFNDNLNQAVSINIYREVSPIRRTYSCSLYVPRILGNNRCVRYVDSRMLTPQWRISCSVIRVYCYGPPHIMS